MSLTLRPFFSYYGAKWRLARRYPVPRYEHVVEPFAGSACYALRHAHLRVTLYEIDPLLVGLWEYLLRVSPDEIRSLPAVVDRVDDLPVCQEAKWLIGFWVGKGRASPRQSASAWMRDGLVATQYWGSSIRERVASQLYAIRHWRVVLGSYGDVGNEAATWFVDPPYVGKGGEEYTYSNARIYYSHLGDWCRNRRGQVIVCEGEGATWLPFRSFASQKATEGIHRTGRSREVIWTNEEAA